ncbi:MAG: transcriptional regulator [Clostridiales bacterium]|nr:transcriptional regulator [Clostridiales bacterium]
MNNRELLELFEKCGHFLYHRRGGKRGQNRIVKLLVSNVSMSQREIQDILDIKSGSLSELVSKLETKGYIKKERDENDRRKIILTVTRAGEEYLDTLEKELTRQEDILFCSLSEEEKEEFYKILEKLLKSWHENFDPSLFGHRRKKDLDGRKNNI